MDNRLNGWKMIAAYLGRDERTARRWASVRGLPVHRIPGGGGGSVFALSSELSAWLTGAAPNFEDVADTAASTEPLRARDKRIWLLAGAALAAGALIIIAAPMTLHRPHAGAEHPSSEQAANHYLAGLHALNGRTPAGLAQAIDDFNATLAIEPRFAPAQVGLADSYNLIREFGTMPDSEAYPKAEAAARAAVAIDPGNAGAHRALAFVLFNFRHDAPQAEKEFTRSLELDPNAARTHHWWATTLLAMGRAGDAMREIQRARELDPEATAIQTDRATILANLGEIGAARIELARLAALDPATPGPVTIGARLALIAHDGPAFVALEHASGRLRADPIATAIADAAARGLAANGWDGMTKAMDGEIERLYANGQINNYQRAVSAVARGDTPRTIALLRSMIDHHEPEAMIILGDCAFSDALRADPSLADKARAGMGLAAKSL